MGIFWKILGNQPNPKLVQGRDYRFIDLMVYDEPLTGIEILTGEYAGVIYYYGKVKITEPEMPDLPAVLGFEYHPKSVPVGVDISTDKFKQLAGDLLTHIMIDNKEDSEYVDAASAYTMNDNREDSYYVETGEYDSKKSHL